jgi:DNA modification methylase
MLFKDRIKDLRRVPASDLKPNPRNWRTHPQSQQDALRGVLAEVGIADAVLARELPDGTLMLLDGHLRAETMPDSILPVLVLDVTEAEGDKILATLDPLAAMAEADAAKLDDLLREVQTGNEALAGMLTELAEEAGCLSVQEPDIVEDEVPEPPVVPITKPGDLWLLGRHRVLCGDSTKAEDVARLMGGERAGLMNTDPPYGVAYSNDERPNPGVAKPRVANDEMTEEKLQAFLEAAFRSAKTYALADNAAWYMWHAHLTQGYFAAAAAAAAADVILHRQIIWVKPVLLLGRGQYHWKHEPCFMGWVKGRQPPDYGEGHGERTQTTVWEIASVTQSERKDFNHSTPKPVGLFAIPIVKHLRAGEIAYEPFSGSGPQIIAAEQLNRTCYGMEISPQYCDVIVKRWENLTGQTATLEAGGGPSGDPSRKA